MKSSRNFWRSLSFLTLVAALGGAMLLPVLAPVQAAPRMQATSCLGTTITQWTFTGDVLTPSTGSGVFSAGAGLPAPTFSTGASGGSDRAISYSGWPLAFDVDSYVDFLIPTSGRNSINLALDYRSTGTGPTIFELQYSTDGINFTSFGSPTTLTNDSTFHSLSYDLSAITALDDNSNSVFRLYAYGASGPTGTLRLDNITLTGNCIIPGNTDTPSPPTSTPTPVAPLSVIINEVAWAGNSSSTTNDEWIELYNPALIDLNGWRLVADDGNPDITFSGITASDTYFVIGRYSSIFSSGATVDLAFTSSMGVWSSLDNNGEILYLLDPNGFVVDTANLDGGGWPAGLGSPTYASMERLGAIADSNTAWATYAGTVPIAYDRSSTPVPVKGTPGQANWITTVTVTPSPVPTQTRTPTFTRTVTLTRTITPTRTPTKPPTASRTPTSVPAQLVAINEFVPRPGRDWNNDGLINTGDEFIELINHGTISVNISGWTLDDEANTGSKPYVLPSRVLQPGERIVFYGNVTGLLLSDGGDGVRLLKPNGGLIDAFNYTVVNYPDQSFCRLPDNGGLDDWNRNCYPTPGLPNSLGSAPGASSSGGNDQLCPIADTLPLEFFLAECAPFGNNVWSRFYWDNTGWYGEMNLPNVDGKWDVFVD
jgi:hypothetical protein